MDTNLIYNQEELFTVELSYCEKMKCLKEILYKINKILYVYEKSLETESYNYKAFCGGILMYVLSSNMMFDGDLINVVVNLNSIISYNFDKATLKKVVFETKNELEAMIKRYRTKHVEQIAG